MERCFQLTFVSGQTAAAIRVQQSDHLSTTLKTLGVETAYPTLVLVGGASGLTADYLDKLRSLFRKVLVPVIETLGATVIDGGTDAGVMQLMGQSHSQAAATFPLIGVAAIGTVILPDNSLAPPKDSAPLEPNHTHFLLVPGERWGDESPWIAQVATALARGMPSVTILINGGEIAWQDVDSSVQANRPVIVIAGSGRTADELTTAIRGEYISTRARELVSSGLLQVVDLSTGLEQIANALTQRLSSSFNPQYHFGF